MAPQFALAAEAGVPTTPGSPDKLRDAAEATQLAVIQQVSTVYVNFTQSTAEVLQLRKALAAGQLRSAGITDLRWGHVLDADWQGHDRFHRKPDSRVPLPLPEGVACYAVAATLASERSALADRLTGDGLVPLDSALGRHADPQLVLHFDAERQWVGHSMNHLQLLSDAAVCAQLLRWLA
mgnify:CR=1 FL=1